MKLTYIYNSGFVIEKEHFTIIIDYWKDSGNCYVQHLLDSCRNMVYVLASHWHPDHFNREIMQWIDKYPNIKYILSDDIYRHFKKFGFFDSVSQITFLSKGAVYQDSNLSIKAFGSTDAGISFLINIEGRQIFHAGDLNNWHWDEDPTSTPDEIRTAESNYLKELHDLQVYTSELDLVMFPIDIRLGKNYMRGAEQFVDAVSCGVFAPMHFGENYQAADAFRGYAEKAGCRFLGWTATGESAELFTRPNSRGQDCGN